MHKVWTVNSNRIRQSLVAACKSLDLLRSLAIDSLVHQRRAKVLLIVGNVVHLLIARFEVQVTRRLVINRVVNPILVASIG